MKFATFQFRINQSCLLPNKLTVVQIVKRIVAVAFVFSYIQSTTHSFKPILKLCTAKPSSPVIILGNIFSCNTFAQ